MERDCNLIANKVLASDLREAIRGMDNLFGNSFIKLLLEHLQAHRILFDDDNNSCMYTFDEINSVLTPVFGEATPLLMSQLEKYLHVEKN